MRKTPFAALLLAILIPLGCFASETVTTLTVGTHISRDSLAVYGTIVFMEPDSSGQFTLLLNPNAEIHAMFFRTEDDSATAHFERTSGDTIVVAQPTTPAFARARVLSFELAIPQDVEDSLIMLDRGNRWYPVIPHGLTTAIVNVVCSPDLEVFSTGDKSTHGVSPLVMHQFISRIPVYKIPLVIARKGLYRSCSRPVGEHEISLNYFSITDSAAQAILDEATTAFEFYQDLLGEYHHKKLTILEVPSFEGTNIGTGILMIGSPTMNAIAAGQRESLTLTIASQWFGAGVFCDFSSRGFWFMSLSFSHYLRLIYEGRFLDSAAFSAKINDNLAAYRKIAGNELDTPIIDIVRPDSREKGIIIYSKGPWLFHQFADCIGAVGITAFARKLYSEFSGKVVSIEQLIEMMSVVDRNCAERLRTDLGGVGL